MHGWQTGFEAQCSRALQTPEDEAYKAEQLRAAMATYSVGF